MNRLHLSTHIILLEAKVVALVWERFLPIEVEVVVEKEGALTQPYKLH